MRAYQPLPASLASKIDIASSEWTHLAATYDPDADVLAFDGIDDHVQLPAMKPDFSQGVTVEAWVNYSSVNSWSRIFDIGSSEGLHTNIILSNINQTTRLRWQIGQHVLDMNELGCEIRQ